MEKWEQAFKDYKAGLKYKEIAEKYGVSINTVKSWASRKWKNSESIKVAEIVATQEKETLQLNENMQPEKKARGAPKGNQNAVGNKGGAPAGNKNAVGNRGGAPIGNKNNLKHGLYEKLLYSAFSEEEKALFQLKEIDKAEELREIIRLCDIQIMRFMRKISEAEAKPGGLLADSVNISIRKIGSEGEIAELKDSVTTTNTIAVHNLILKYNDAIEKVKRQKIKCLEDLKAMEENAGSSEAIGTGVQIYLPGNRRGDSK